MKHFSGPLPDLAERSLWAQSVSGSPGTEL